MAHAMADDLLELRMLAEQVTDRPGFLAYHLAYFDEAAIRQRLACSLTTALALPLCRTPRLYCWLPDVRAIARGLRLDPSRLAAFLREAEAFC